MMILRHIALGSVCLGELAHGMFGGNLHRRTRGFREMASHRHSRINNIAPLAVGDVKINNLATLAVDGSGEVDPRTGYKAYYLTVPLDHFHNDSLYDPHTNETFRLRYWFDASHYKEGAGPVIVLQGGETSGTDRLPFLQKGIIAQLAKATNGLGVVLEHRYYDGSIPGNNFSLPNLRFLTTDQAMADMAYFARNVVFDGLEHLNLTAPNTAYFAYGASYAGAFVALLRKIYPDVYYGAIASSAVIEVIYNFYQYYDAPRIFGPSDCITATQHFVTFLDNLLLGKVDNSPDLPQRLKNVFDLGEFTYDDDFAYVVTDDVGWFQVQNWDPEEGNPQFGYYCGNITSPTLIYPEVAGRKTEVQYLMNSAGFGDERDTLFTTQILNYIGYMRLVVGQFCNPDEPLVDCWTNHNRTLLERYDTTQWWRPYRYQQCTELGQFLTDIRDDNNQSILPLISTLVDMNWKTLPCKLAFNITTPPNVEKINRYGGFNFSYPRLAWVDGEKDTWRQGGPHAIGLAPRKSTISEPFMLIEGAFHHWDQNGAFPNETRPGYPPKEVLATQKTLITAVKIWFDEWKRETARCGNPHSPHP